MNVLPAIVLKRVFLHWLGPRDIALLSRVSTHIRREASSVAVTLVSWSTILARDGESVWGQLSALHNIMSIGFSPLSASGDCTACINRHGDLLTCGSGPHGHPQCRDKLQRLTKCELLQRTIHVSIGLNHAAAVLYDGTMVTWGSGDCGQLGYGGRSFQLRPRVVSSLVSDRKRVRVVACGTAHTLAATFNGELFSCGRDQHGELGHGTGANVDVGLATVLVPRRVETLARHHVLQGMQHSYTINWLLLSPLIPLFSLAPSPHAHTHSFRQCQQQNQ
jgi:alpha-tubulin suppressor-like RCC1 family protein